MGDALDRLTVRLARLQRVQAYRRRGDDGGSEAVRSYVRKDLDLRSDIGHGLTKAGIFAPQPVTFLPAKTPSDLPKGLVIVPTWGSYGSPSRTLEGALARPDPSGKPRAVSAFIDGKGVGSLTWGSDGNITGIGVYHSWQRRGIATEMLRQARLIDPNVHHSKILSADGRAFKDANPITFKPATPTTYLPAKTPPTDPFVKHGDILKRYQTDAFTAADPGSDAIGNTFVADINGGLRSPRMGGPDTPEEIPGYADLHDAVAAFPAEKDLTVYRGGYGSEQYPDLYPAPWSKPDLHQLVGETRTDPGFMSTSEDPATAREFVGATSLFAGGPNTLGPKKVLLTLNVPKGYPAAPLYRAPYLDDPKSLRSGGGLGNLASDSDLADYAAILKEQKERLLQAGTRYKITKVEQNDKGVWQIYGDVLPPTAAAPSVRTGGRYLLDGKPIEVLGYAKKYDGENDQLRYVPEGTLDEDAIDFSPGDFPDLRPVPADQPAPDISDDFRASWMADYGTGYVDAMQAAADRVVANDQIQDPEDLDAARALRALDAATPQDAPLYRGLYVSDPAERAALVSKTRESGFSESLGSWSTNANVAKDFALGVERQGAGDPRTAVVIQTVGPVKSLDLNPGTDESERVSGGHFAYVSDSVAPDGTTLLQVRQDQTSSPDDPLVNQATDPLVNRVALAGVTHVGAYRRRGDDGGTEAVRAYVRKDLDFFGGLGGGKTKRGIFTGALRAVAPALDEGDDGLGEASDKKKITPEERTAIREKLAANPVKTANILDMYGQATSAERERGRHWYPDAHKIAVSMGQAYGVPTREASGMLATYSPQTPWGRNLMVANEVLRTHQPVGGKGAHLSIVKTPGDLEETRYGVMASGVNRRRAKALLGGQDFEDLFAGGRNKNGSLKPNSLKIRAFGELIDRGGQDPDQDVPWVVVDRHAASVARGTRLTDNDYAVDGPSSSKKKYDVYATAYRDAAKALSTKEGRAVTPEEVQATTWLTRQRLNQDDVASRRALGVRDTTESLNYFASYNPDIADIVDDPMVGYASNHPDPEVRSLVRDPVGPNPPTSVKHTKITDYDGEVGNPDHITRTEVGTVPTRSIAEMPGARGEEPGKHLNRTGPAWDKFLADVKANGITSKIFITADYGKPAVISEGNHRRDAAVALGLTDVPVEIRYFGHAEQTTSVGDVLPQAPDPFISTAADPFQHQATIAPIKRAPKNEPFDISKRAHFTYNTPSAVAPKIGDTYGRSGIVRGVVDRGDHWVVAISNKGTRSNTLANIAKAKIT